MVDPKAVLRGGIVAGTVGLAAASVANTVSASHPDILLNSFNSSAYPGENPLGEWSNHVGFADASVTDGVLRLEYDDGGFFATNAHQGVSSYDRLELVMRGDEGGEEEDIQLTVGNVQDSLADLTNDSIGTTFSTIRVDLDAVGVGSAVDVVRLSFWEGASGAVEIDSIAIVSDHEVESDITAETTFEEFYTDQDSYEYAEFEDPIRAWVEYLPGEAGSGHNDNDQTNWPDSEKIAEFDVDVDAVRAKQDSDEPLTFAEMGTQALGHVQQFDEYGFPRHASAKLLGRLSLLPDFTEEPTYHNPPAEVWDETAGPVEATNDPGILIQDPWPPDARSYQQPGKVIRDRAHDQPIYEGDPDHMWYNPDAEWTQHDLLPDDRYRDASNPIHDIAEKVHPATGEGLGGDGFTANAPMEVEARIHVESNGYWNQLLEFKNTSPVPYHLNAAVIMWIGPMGANGNLRDGHYNNEQRLSPGHGHPQRDVIEVVHDEERRLSAYAVRLAFHDEPYHKRTAYPNQLWSLEVGMPEQSQYFSTAAERQELVDTMANTCHVEIETDMDRNIDLLDAVNLRNRMTN